MKIFRRIVLLAIFAVFGFLIGSVFRRTKQPPQNDVAVVKRARSDFEKTEAVKTVELSLIAQLKRDLANSSGLTRWLHWVAAIEKAPIEQFLALAELAQGDTAALRLIAMRWVELNPKHLLDTLAERGDRSKNWLLSEVLFQEWAKRDPEALIKELGVGSSLGPLRAWRSDAAEQIIRHHPKLGLPLFERWSLGMYTPSMRGVAKWAAEKPREAAEFTMGIRSQYAATAAMEAIGEQWGKVDPRTAISYAEGQENSLGRTLASSILKTWAERDLSAAADWLAQTDENQRNKLSAQVVEQWAKSDPAAALLWCEKNLAGSSLTKAAAGVLRGAAEKDPQGAARLVLAMQPSAARSAAAVEVAAKILPRGEGKVESPTPGTIDWLHSLDPDATRRVLEQAVRYWPNVDVQSMASFLQATLVDQIPSSVYLLVGRNLARTDPEGALEWANQLPEYARLAGGSDAFARWTQSQPENAMRWLNNIPSGDSRRSAYLKTALEYLAYEHNVAERVSALPLLDRRVALDLAKSLDLPPERRERLLSALQP